MLTRQRTTTPVKPAVRLALENYVVAWNTVLRRAVGRMNNIVLLRNANPTYRGDFAREMMNSGLISVEEAREFNIIRK